MDYVQERIATLHDLTGEVPDAPVAEAAVVVPMTAEERGSPAAEHALETLGTLEPERVIVPVRSPAEEIDAVREWLAGFDAPTQLLWCNGPAVEELLERSGLAADVAAPAGASEPPLAGKGRDVWLGLGVAASTAPYVAVHDADASSYDAEVVPRLLAPLADGFAFTKGYYARVEDDGLYGRLVRLFYEPLVGALAGRHDEPVLEYLAAFRYALAGEFATTAELARSMRAQRAWGLEVGTLGEAFRLAGAAGTAQVDLGVHRHDHRSVEGEGGLAAMSRQVGDALFRALADHDVEPEFEALRADYRRTAVDAIEQYAADARYNGLPYDRERERAQVESYADAVAPPGPDLRLPAWEDAPCSPLEVVEASEQALAGATASQ